MRFLPHILLAYVAIGLQRGLEPLLSTAWGRADLVLIVTGFISACVPGHPAALVAALIGLSYDLTGAGPVGLHAASFGLAGLAISTVPARRWSRVLAAMVAFIAIATLLAWLLGLLRRAGGEEMWIRPGFGESLGTILLTGLLAVAVSAGLWRWRRVFVVEPRN